MGWRDDRQKAYACIRDTFEKGDILPSRQNLRQKFEQKSGIPPARAFRLSAVRGCVLRCRLTPAGGRTRPASERGSHRRSRFCGRGRIVHHILSSEECQGLYRTGAIHAARGPFEWLSPIRGDPCDSPCSAAGGRRASVGFPPRRKWRVASGRGEIAVDLARGHGSRSGGRGMCDASGILRTVEVISIRLFKALLLHLY